MTLRGHCYCRNVDYELEEPLGPVVSCHCGFCRRIHGAAFTTVALIPTSAIRLSQASVAPSKFTTPLGNVRHFCGRCASPLWNQSPADGLAVVIVSSLREDSQPAPWAHVNVESKAAWFPIEDALPRFSAWPQAEELEQLIRLHPGSWRPHQILGPAVQ